MAKECIKKGSRVHPVPCAPLDEIEDEAPPRPSLFLLYQDMTMRPKPQVPPGSCRPGCGAAQQMKKALETMRKCSCGGKAPEAPPSAPSRNNCYDTAKDAAPPGKCKCSAVAAAGAGGGCKGGAFKGGVTGIQASVNRCGGVSDEEVNNDNDDGVDNSSVNDRHEVSSIASFGVNEGGFNDTGVSAVHFGRANGSGGARCSVPNCNCANETSAHTVHVSRATASGAKGSVANCNCVNSSRGNCTGATGHCDAASANASSAYPKPRTNGGFGRRTILKSSSGLYGDCPKS